MSHELLPLDPVNGNWIQTIAYIINGMQHQLDNLIPSGSTSGETLCVTSEEITIFEEKILPRLTVYVQTSGQQLPTSTKARYQAVYSRPAPQVIRVPFKLYYERCCGSWNPQQDKYVKCMECVDSYLAAHTNAQLGDITPSGTGCSIKGYNAPQVKKSKPVIHAPSYIIQLPNNQAFQIKSK